MSLIQEALKRQREEAAGGRTAAAASTPAASAPAAASPAAAPAPSAPGIGRPPPLPMPAPAPVVATAEAAPMAAAVLEGEPHRRNWLSLIGILLLVLLLTGGGIGLLMFAYQQWTDSKSSQTLVSMPVAEAPVAEPEAEPVAPVAPVTPVPPPVPSVPVASVPTPPPAVTPGVPPAAAAGGDLLKTPVRAELEWPALRITGVMGRGSRGAATINGRVVAVGERAEGVDVVSIGDGGVKLTFRGETRFVKVGASADE